MKLRLTPAGPLVLLLVTGPLFSRAESQGQAQSQAQPVTATEPALSSAEKIRAGLDPLLDSEACNAAVSRAAYYVSKEEAVLDEWRDVVLEALRDARTRSSFRYFLYPAVLQRSSGLREIDPESALVQMLAFYGEVRSMPTADSASQQLLLDYCEARLYRESGKIVESLARYERLMRDIAADALQRDSAATEGLAGLENTELAQLTSFLPDEISRNLIEVGLIKEAFGLAKEKGASPSTKAEVELSRGRPGRALAELQVEIPYRDRVSASQVRGVAEARLGHRDAAHSVLGAVIRNEWLESAGTPPAGELDYGWGARQRAALVLAEMEAEAGQFSAIPAALDTIDWRQGTSRLYGARRGALVALWAVKTGQPTDVRGDAIAAMRAAYGHWVDLWKSIPAVPGGIRFLQEPSRGQLITAVLEVELSTPDGAVSALTSLLMAQSCGTLAKQIQAAESSVQALKDYAKDARGGVVVVLPLPKETHLFLVDRDGASHLRRPSRQLLDAETPDLRRFLEAPERGVEASATLERYGRTVTQKVFGPEVVRRLSGWESVTFVGFERLTELSPTLLLDADGNWLGCTKVVTEWPSVPVGLSLMGRPRAVSGVWKALVDPAPMEETSGYSLPFDELEQGRLAAACGGAANVHTGRAAELSALSTGPTALLYLHCHGEVDPRARRPGRLLLAEAGATTAEAIEDRFLDKNGPAVVVLAACNAGRSRTYLGEDGSESLSSAFTIVGARSLLVPRREIFHVPTKHFCLALLEELRRGTPIGEAVRLCRSAMVANGYDPRDVTGLRLLGATH